MPTKTILDLSLVVVLMILGLITAIYGVKKGNK
jgi:hypothetical protein